MNESRSWGHMSEEVHVPEEVKMTEDATMAEDMNETEEAELGSRVDGDRRPIG